MPQTEKATRPGAASARPVAPLQCSPCARSATLLPPPGPSSVLSWNVLHDEEDQDFAIIFSSYSHPELDEDMEDANGSPHLIIGKHKSCIRPTFAEKQYGRISYDALSKGTNGFSEANLLGKGSFGAVYKCTFEDKETIAAVQVFNLEHHGSTRSFMAECEALRRVRHRCLIKIITCCSSINHQGQDFKALVFEFMPNGSLNDWLHPKFDMPTLNLAQRLDIAVDVMDALDYLHNHCHPPIIHCDIKPSNILLAKDMSSRVGEFGLSRILTECASKTMPNSNSMLGIIGSVGYVAPEYGEGSYVSVLGDVYSLGILLLEMFTGKSPIDDMFRSSLDLHKFCKDALPK